MVNRNKYLSWLLRHGAAGQGLAMDEAGWVSVDDLLRIAGISRVDLDRVMNSDSKHRLQCVEEQIRACQGHSLEVGVSREALEKSWSTYRGESSIWHGTLVGAITQIASEGLLPGDRTHVHCASTADSIVGKRAGAQVLLEISPAQVRAAGLDIFEAPNGVVLVRQIPRDAIVGLMPRTREARKQETQMRTALGFKRVVK